jgi:hypothetical protein
MQEEIKQNFFSRKLPVPVLVRVAHGTVNARRCVLLTCWELLLKVLLDDLVLGGWHVVLLLPLLVRRSVQVVERIRRLQVRQVRIRHALYGEGDPILLLLLLLSTRNLVDRWELIAEKVRVRTRTWSL